MNKLLLGLILLSATFSSTIKYDARYGSYQEGMLDLKGTFKFINKFSVRYSNASSKQYMQYVMASRKFFLKLGLINDFSSHSLRLSNIFIEKGAAYKFCGIKDSYFLLDSKHLKVFEYDYNNQVKAEFLYLKNSSELYSPYLKFQVPMEIVNIGFGGGYNYWKNNTGDRQLSQFIEATINSEFETNYHKGCFSGGVIKTFNVEGANESVNHNILFRNHIDRLLYEKIFSDITVLYTGILQYALLFGDLEFFVKLRGLYDNSLIMTSECGFVFATYPSFKCTVKYQNDLPYFLNQADPEPENKLIIEIATKGGL